MEERKVIHTLAEKGSLKTLISGKQLIQIGKYFVILFSIYLTTVIVLFVSLLILNANPILITGVIFIPGFIFVISSYIIIFKKVFNKSIFN